MLNIPAKKRIVRALCGEVEDEASSAGDVAARTRLINTAVASGPRIAAASALT